MSNATSSATRPAYFTGVIGKLPLISYVDPAPGLKGTDKVATPCNRCSGTGNVGIYWVHNGVCFQCWGTRTQNTSVTTVRKNARQAAYLRDYAAEIEAYHTRIANERIAAAAVAEAERQEAARIAEEARLANLVQGFIAEVGEKVADVEITVKVAKYCSGSYNRSASMFVIAETTEGKVIKFSGSAQSVMALEKGDRAVITTGKVKEHAEYNEQEQTVLSHVKVAVLEGAAV